MKNKDILGDLIKAQAILWSINSDDLTKEQNDFLEKILKLLALFQRTLMEVDSEYWGN